MKLWVKWERSLLLDLTVPFLHAQNFISFSKLVFYVLCTLYLRERKTDFPSNMQILLRLWIGLFAIILFLMPASGWVHHYNEFIKMVCD